MHVAEQIANIANQNVSGTGERQLASDTPLQIRMNPFMAAAKRAAFFDARIYLVERASSIGRPHLFTQDAQNLAIDGSGGLQRNLRAIAQFAFFAAAAEGASQIDSRHVVSAMQSWAAQNGEPVPQQPRVAETALRMIPAAEAAKPPQVPPPEPAAIENKTANAAPPASEAKVPPEAIAAQPPSDADISPEAIAAPLASEAEVPPEAIAVPSTFDAEFAPQAPAAFENGWAIVALPAYDALPAYEALPAYDAMPASDSEPAQPASTSDSADGEAASAVSSPSLIRRQVLDSIEAEARDSAGQIQTPKRQWFRRSVEMTVAFLTLFAVFGTISSYITNGSSPPAKPVPAVQIQQVDVTEAVVQPPAPPQPPAQTYVIPEPIKEVVAVSPPAAEPVSEPVENAVADNPTPEELQEQVPTEDHMKSETP